MLRFLSRLKIMYKLWIIVGAALVCICITESLYLDALKSTLLEGKELKTQHVVETAYGVLEHFHDEEKAGRLTREEAQRQAIEALRKFRYEGKEYFWLNDMKPVMIMHPFRPALEGQDLSGLADRNGRRMFVEMVKVVSRQQEGLVEYLWEKPGEKQ